jgi:hypothetical protein
LDSSNLAILCLLFDDFVFLVNAADPFSLPLEVEFVVANECLVFCLASAFPPMAVDRDGTPAYDTLDLALDCPPDI